MLKIKGGRWLFPLRCIAAGGAGLPRLVDAAGDAGFPLHLANVARGAGLPLVLPQTLDLRRHLDLRLFAGFEFRNNKLFERFSVENRMSGREPAAAPGRKRKRLSLASRDGAQVLARSVHLHPGCHGSPWRLRVFVRRHPGNLICAGGECPCDGREPCPPFRASCCSYQPRTARPRLKATRKRLAIQAHHAMRSVVVSEICGVEPPRTK